MTMSGGTAIPLLDEEMVRFAVQNRDIKTKSLLQRQSSIKPAGRSLLRGTAVFRSRTIPTAPLSSLKWRGR